jgi:hypothetical protein
MDEMKTYLVRGVDSLWAQGKDAQQRVRRHKLTAERL